MVSHPVSVFNSGGLVTRGYGEDQRIITRGFGKGFEFGGPDELHGIRKHREYIFKILTPLEKDSWKGFGIYAPIKMNKIESFPIRMIIFMESILQLNLGTPVDSTELFEILDVI